MKKLVLFVFLYIIAVSSTLAQETETLVVFAATSLTNAFEDLEEAFEAENPQVNVVLNFSSSSTLASQLLQGAPADVYASANEIQMQRLVDDELIDEQAVINFGYNRLVLIVPADNPANIDSAEQLINNDLAIVLPLPETPIRVYTNTLLDELETIFGDGYVDTLMQNVVSEESNVRQVVTRIILGEADAAFVYQTDVTPNVADDLLTIPLPDNIVMPLAQYPIAVLHDTDSSPIAQAFVDFVLSDAGQAILVEWGFCVVDNSEMEAEAEVTPEPTDKPEIKLTCETETP